MALRTITIIAALLLAGASYVLGAAREATPVPPSGFSVYVASDCVLGVLIPNDWGVSRPPSLRTEFDIVDAARGKAVSFSCYKSLDDLSFSPGHGGFKTLRDYLRDPMFRNVETTTVAGRPGFKAIQDNDRIDYHSVELFVEVNGRIYNIGHDEASPYASQYEQIIAGITFGK